ncbi:MAG: TauD/TfdA family dioxygenase [Pseudomonadota bacterium]
MTDASFTIVPLSPAVGAEIRGIDLARDLDQAEIAAIKQAWHRHLVLLFRDQILSPARLVAFSRSFGDLDIAPPNENGQRFVPDYPEILVISNVIENGIAIGSLGAGEAAWHTDMSYLERPPLGSALFALEVPASGGETGFANMYRALETLPAALRSEIEGKAIKHDSSTNSAGYLREGAQAVDDVTCSPGARHLIIRIHSETGRPALYLGRRANAYVDGLPLARSEALLDALWSHATGPEMTWHHRWKPGDLVLWDNRCVVHRRAAFDPALRRIMHRTQIASQNDL